MTVTTSPQFGTTCQVTVIPAFGPGVVINPDVTPGTQQLRVDWSVTKGIGGTSPSIAEVTAHNLKQTSRDRIAGLTRRIVDFSDEFAFLDGRMIEGSDLGGTSTVTATGFGVLKIAAKYQGSTTTANIFEGSSTRVISRKPRHTWVTRIEGGDGTLQNSSAIADKFWGGTVPAPEVVDYLVRRVMVAELATSLPVALAKYSFAGGYDATNFYASDILDQLTELTRTEWWWDGGAVYFSDVGAALPGNPIIVSPRAVPGSTRLLQKPRRTEDGNVEIVTLLLPDMIPKQSVTVVADELGGTYYASSVTHRGSNRSGVSKTITVLKQPGVVPFL